LGSSFTTRETVFMLTPARAATSRIRARGLPFVLTQDPSAHPISWVRAGFSLFRA
jgi:hypothetical protein